MTDHRDTERLRRERLEAEHPNLDVLSAVPENAQLATRRPLEAPFTSTSDFFIRNHYPTPAVDEAEWTLSLAGLVDQPGDRTLADLRESLPTDTITHTMVCSGNGRAAFEPPAKGHQWSFGAVSTATWTGTPLADLLEAHGAATDEDLWLAVVGADAPAGEPVFARSLPMSKVLDDCLLAYQMNGEPLPAVHGFPARLVVPGWYGNNSVKWVRELRVMETMLHGEAWERYSHWQQRSYRLVPKGEEPVEHATIDVFDTQDQMESDDIRHPYMYDELVNSIVVAPDDGTVVSTSQGAPVEVVGAAWAGDDAVESVAVSTDGGRDWHAAELVGPGDGRSGWRQFRFDWDASPGEHVIVSRATDDRGRTQPAVVSDPDEGLVRITDDKFPWNQEGYGNNAYETNAARVTVERA